MLQYDYNHKPKSNLIKKEEPKANQNEMKEKQSKRRIQKKY